MNEHLPFDTAEAVRSSSIIDAMERNPRSLLVVCCGQGNSTSVRNQSDSIQGGDRTVFSSGYDERDLYSENRSSVN